MAHNFAIIQTTVTRGGAQTQSKLVGTLSTLEKATLAKKRLDLYSGARNLGYQIKIVKQKKKKTTKLELKDVMAISGEELEMLKIKALENM